MGATTNIFIVAVIDGLVVREVRTGRLINRSFVRVKNGTLVRVLV